MLYIFSAEIKSGNVDEFQDWVRKNKEGLNNSAPSGIKFKAAYLAALGFGDHLAEVHWEVSEYGAFDKARAALQSPGEYAQTLKQLYSFFDTRHWQARLLRDITSSDPKEIPLALID